ncbi:MAG: hypothetical protein EHM27_09705 [Deltaproteobacteria bacterium]|nr:MAG: hypothetical protein EHM27_09705 [Deltaproteobacteria bacterium]
MKSIITLTPEESKRLIAKAIVQMDAVQKAKKDGIIGLARCSSCAYIVEELTGRKMENLMRYCSGYIGGPGSCAVLNTEQERLLVLYHGEEKWLHYTEGNILKFIDEMDQDDVIIKSGNVLDPSGQVGTLVAHPTGGEAGYYLPHILAKGIHLIVPTLISKSIPFPLSRLLTSLGISRIRVDRTHGIVCGMIPLPGTVITEIDAIRLLSGAESLPIGVNGIGTGKGSVTLLVEGAESEVDAAWEMVNSIKGEPHLSEFPSRCDVCYIKNDPERKARCQGRE